MAASMSRAILSFRTQLMRHSTLRCFVPVLNSLPLQSSSGIQPVWKFQAAAYAKKAGKGAKKSVEPKEIMEVSTDPHYLVTHCSGANYFKDGQDIKLGPDEDYPDWLWGLHIGPPPKLEEMSPDTPQYWRRLRKMHMKRNNRMAKTKKF